MNAELFFIYDTHCPWSYAATALVNEIAKAFPQMNLHLWHSARYEGDECISLQTIKAVSQDSNAELSTLYTAQLSQEKDSTVAANIMAWAQQKVPQLVLPLLNALQEKHFQQGIALTNLEELNGILNELKLSPPAKIFSKAKLSKDAQITLHDIAEFQEVIQTNAIPALLLAVNDNLILLNHNLYLKAPASIVEAVALELKE